jgi:hypothetical protein
MVHLTGEVYPRAEGVLRRRSKGGPIAIYRVANPSRLGRRGGNHWPYGRSVDSLCGETPHRRGVKRSILILGQDTIQGLRLILPPVRWCTQFMNISQPRRRSSGSAISSSFPISLAISPAAFCTLCRILGV